jgi:diguanylate cyclase (GGDEF)-like protein
MARHDALTNLPNRVLFQDKMEKALARGDRIALMFLDLDRFKSVNDSLGHSVGDALLCAVTERLQGVVAPHDTVARLGGDEFAIVQRDATPAAASELASEVIAVLGEPFEVQGHQLIVGTSIGIAMAPADGSEPDQLLRNADMALYRAKSDGRGTYHFFQPEMDALLRWKHPERGLVPPDEFIPVAEERAHRAAWRLGSQTGVPRRRQVAGQNHDRREPFAGAVPQSDAGAVGCLRAGPVRTCGIAARIGNH